MLEVNAALMVELSPLGLSSAQCANLRAEIRLEFTALLRGDDTRAVCLAFLFKKPMRR